MTRRKGGNTLYHTLSLYGLDEWYRVLPPSDQKTLILTVKDVLHSLYRPLLHAGDA